MPPLVEVRDLVVARGDKDALQGVTFDLAPGRIVALVGDNGAGKTTLLRALFGELPRRRGTVRVCGLDPYEEDGQRELWRWARLVGDTPDLYDELTVAEQLAFSARAYGVPEASVKGDVESAAQELGFVDKLPARIKTLSAGERRKVHIASGFFSGQHGPRLLVLDEPTANLDPGARSVFADALRRYVGIGPLASERSVVISSHELAELDEIADDFVMLGQGKVSLTGSISELAARQTTDLSYRLALFEARAAELAVVLHAEHGLECTVVNDATVAFKCPSAARIQRVLRALVKHDSRFRVRSLDEELSALERVYIDGLAAESRP